MSVHDTIQPIYGSKKTETPYTDSSKLLRTYSESGVKIKIPHRAFAQFEIFWSNRDSHVAYFVA